MEKRTYLAISKEDKNEAVRAAGKLPDGSYPLQYDRSQKLWYAVDGADLEKVKKWLPENIVSGNSEHIEYKLEPAEEFALVLEEAGFLLPGNGLPEMDGKVHRVPSKMDKDGATSCVYKGYSDGHPAGWYQNHRSSDDLIHWKSSGTRKYDPVESLKNRVMIAQKLWDRDIQAKINFAKMGRRLTTLWSKLPVAPHDHPYLLRKKLPASDGIKLDSYGNLVIPLSNSRGEIRSLEYIKPDGTKTLKADAEKTGNYFVVGGELSANRPILYAEGYATAASISLAAGMPVVMTVDAGNLVSVAKELKAKYPDTPHIVCGDDDYSSRNTKGHLDNRGAKKAKEAATLTSGVCILPVFSESERAQTFAKTAHFSDFNDIHCFHGLDALRDQLAPVLDKFIPHWRQNIKEDYAMPDSSNLNHIVEDQPEALSPEPMPVAEPDKPEPTASEPEPTAEPDKPEPTASEPEPTAAPDKPEPTASEPEPTAAPDKPEPAASEPELTAEPDKPEPAASEPEPTAEPDKPEPAASEPEPTAEPDKPEPAASEPEQASPESPELAATSTPETADLEPSESATLAPESAMPFDSVASDDVPPVVENGFNFTFGRLPGDVSPQESSVTPINLDELLQGLTSRQDGKTWVYSLDGEDAFRDYGDRIVMATPESSENDRMILAALLSAKANQRGAVEITGSDDFILRTMTLIADHKIDVHLKNPLQRKQFEELLKARAENDIPQNGLNIGAAETPDSSMAPAPESVAPVSNEPIAQPDTPAPVTAVQPNVAPTPVAATEPVMSAPSNKSSVQSETPPLNVLEREVLRTGLTGKLLDAGKAPYLFDENKSESFYVQLRTKDGNKTYWGIELQQALADSGKEIGDMIKLQFLGKKPVTINVPNTDDNGIVTGFKPLETHRNQWAIKPAEDNRLLVSDRNAVAPAELSAYDGNAFWTLQQNVVQSAQLSVSVAPPTGHGLLYTTPDGAGCATPQSQPVNVPLPTHSKAAGSVVMQARDGNGDVLAHLVKAHGDYLQGVVRHEGQLQNVLARICKGNNGNTWLSINAVQANGDLQLIGHASAVNNVANGVSNYDTFAFQMKGPDAPKFAVPLVSPEKIPPALHNQLGFTQAYTPPKVEEPAQAPRMQAAPAHPQPTM